MMIWPQKIGTKQCASSATGNAAGGAGNAESGGGADDLQRSGTDYVDAGTPTGERVGPAAARSGCICCCHGSNRGHVMAMAKTAHEGAQSKTGSRRRKPR